MGELEPGVLTTDSGATYIVGDPIGLAPEPGTPCDAAGASVNILTGECRCVVCPRCRHHTGNSHQGHYWALCKVLAERVRAELADCGETLPVAEFMRRATREFHFCCPESPGCELEEAGGG